jgi:hypothetical protein
MSERNPERGGASEMIARFLANRDASCPVCQYNLRDNASSVCPECGAVLELRLGSRDLHLGAWLVALLGVSLPLGFVVPLFVISIIVEWTQGMSGPPGALAILGGAIIPHGLATAALISLRHRFWRRSHRTQWVLAIASAVASSLALGAVIWGLFAD